MSKKLKEVEYSEGEVVITLREHYVEWDPESIGLSNGIPVERICDFIKILQEINRDINGVATPQTITPNKQWRPKPWEDSDYVIPDSPHFSEGKELEIFKSRNEEMSFNRQ